MRDKKEIQENKGVFLVDDLSFARLRHFGNLYALVVLDYALVVLDCALVVLALTLCRVFTAFVTSYDIRQHFFK